MCELTSGTRSETCAIPSTIVTQCSLLWLCKVQLLPVQAPDSPLFDYDSASKESVATCKSHKLCHPEVSKQETWALQAKDVDVCFKGLHTFLNFLIQFSYSCQAAGPGRWVKIPQVFASIQGETTREKPCDHKCLENDSRHTYYKERLSRATPWSRTRTHMFIILTSCTVGKTYSSERSQGDSWPESVCTTSFYISPKSQQ